MEEMAKEKQKTIDQGDLDLIRTFDPDKTQVGGDHYKKMAIQPTEYIISNGLSFCEGNVVKYVTRHKVKGGAEDLRKAIHYLELLLKHEYGN